jgi:hypothetical protein
VRRESSTVVAVVGEVPDVLLAELSESPNVSVVRPRAMERDRPPDGDGPAAGNGVEMAARALRAAAGRVSPFVLVAADPLADMAAEWRAMWDVSRGPLGGAGFEERAAQALSAWRAGRFELPDYYLVLIRTEAEASESGLYLGPLRAIRPRRVAVAGTADGPGQSGRVLDALRSLPHGPWWPPLDEVVDIARGFFAGGLADGKGATAAAPALG